jgi:hypothetical protein
MYQILKMQLDFALPLMRSSCNPWFMFSTLLKPEGLIGKLYDLCISKFIDANGHIT